MHFPGYVHRSKCTDSPLTTTLTSVAIAASPTIVLCGRRLIYTDSDDPSRRLASDARGAGGGGGGGGGGGAGEVAYIGVDTAQRYHSRRLFISKVYNGEKLLSRSFV